MAGPASAVTPIDRQGNVIGGATPGSPGYYQNVGPASIATGQQAVTTSATLVVPARAGRQAVTLSSATAVAYWIGPAGVTNATGFSVPAVAGSGITIPTQGAVFAVGASAVTITYLETF